MSLALIEEGEYEEARRYYNIGRRALYEGSAHLDRYKQLQVELESKKMTGTLYRVVPGKGFGFLDIDGQPGQSAFLYMSNVTPPVTVGEFDKLEGRKFSFLIGGRTGRSPNAVKACPIEQK